MRHLLVPAAATLDCSNAMALESTEAVRGLSTRFPHAGLRRAMVVRAPSLDRVADSSGGTRVWLTLENLQVTGSFKVRGALCALDIIRKAGCHAVVASSAGNHGVGVAHAAALLDLQATVVVPEHAALNKIEAMRSRGARIIQVAGSYDIAEQHARQLAVRSGTPFVSPYDDVATLTGNGTSLGFEIVEDLRRVPDHVLVPVGGGGLATGMAWALGRESRQDPRTTRRVWGVQSELSAAFAQSVVQQAAVEQLLSASPTLAEGLEGGISASSFRRTAAVVEGVVVVGELEIAGAMVAMYRSLGMRLEGSAATVLVPILQGLPEELRGGDLVAVLTGRNVEPVVFERLLRCAQVNSTCAS